MSIETPEKFQIVLSVNLTEKSEKYRKRFVRDSIDLVLLSFLENYGSLHGYKLFTKEKFGSNPGASTVYPWHLGREGCIKSEIVQAQKLKSLYNNSKRT